MKITREDINDVRFAVDAFLIKDPLSTFDKTIEPVLIISKKPHLDKIEVKYETSVDKDGDAILILTPVEAMYICHALQNDVYIHNLLLKNGNSISVRNLPQYILESKPNGEGEYFNTQFCYKSKAHNEFLSFRVNHHQFKSALMEMCNYIGANVPSHIW